jgi:hypothetical protein
LRTARRRRLASFAASVSELASPNRHRVK